jgi:hypothetical protein
MEMRGLNKDSYAEKYNFILLPTLILFLKFPFQKSKLTSWLRTAVLSYLHIYIFWKFDANKTGLYSHH